MKRTRLRPMSDRRRAELSAAGVVPSSTFAPPTAAPKTRRRDTGPDPATVAVVLERAGYGCERCCDPVGPRRGTDYHLHHRRPRAQGGTSRPDANSPANLVVLCPGCHQTVEQFRADALAEGWLVPQSGDPATAAILMHRGSRWAYLDADGRLAAVPARRSGVAS